MRVLLVVHGFPPAASGGTEIYVRDLARALRDLGDSVRVLAREADPARPERTLRQEKRDGLDLVLVNNTFRDRRRFEASWRDPAMLRLVAAVLDEWHPDVCHVHHLTGLTADLAEETRARGIPTLVTLNDYWLLCQRGQLLDLDLARCAGPHPAGCARCLHTSRRNAARRTEGVARIFETATHFLAPSATLLERFLAHGLRPDRVTLARQGIDHRPFRGLERAPGERLRLGYVGSLMASKGPAVLLEAFAGLSEGAATLALYGPLVPYHGDSRYTRRLEPLLRTPGVRWSGEIPHEQVPEALASLDVLVVPSVWIENAPFVVKEAFCAGVPVVASDLGGIAELVEHERSGLLFPPGDAGALRAALVRLVREPELLARLRRGLPDVMTIAQDAARTRELYARLAREPRSRSGASGG
jgi:glycosyltransferase involved in cell wall biosynthesis